MKSIDLLNSWPLHESHLKNFEEQYKLHSQNFPLELFEQFQISHDDNSFQAKGLKLTREKE